jgi:hypothetical protein
MPKMLMNITGSTNSRTIAQLAVRAAPAPSHPQSVRLNLMGPMINRVASAKASCGACGK